MSNYTITEDMEQVVINIVRKNNVTTDQNFTIEVSMVNSTALQGIQTSEAGFLVFKNSTFFSRC